ncbi:MAG: 16S rRNA (cytosine(967)-C(5))-methyltransferase RsmB [Acidobacteria bacterium]|nr:16S rRNA (cytosine(967)-C(5))-methyltransferase RsmB [Acidobacteriota bacterium]
MTAPARVAAYHALRAIADERADLPTALAQSRQHLSDERDRALTAEIVAGTLRWQRSLDYLIEHFAARPLDKVDRDVLHILRLSLYQLLHLDRVPASAVVDDAVDLTRLARKTSASGFVNAVLRTTVRQRSRLPLPPRPDEGGDRDAMLTYLGITQSHPEWLVARWLDRYGFDATERWVRFNNEPPPLTLRANTLRGSRETLTGTLGKVEVSTEPTRHAPHGLVVTAGNPLREPSATGAFFVQDEASQLVTLVVDAQPGEHILDLCASPGGKTTAMAADMRDTGLLVACDVRPRRIALLKDTVRSSGASRIRVVRVPSEGPLPFATLFDRVLVDAPCSGLGTVRRDPDIRWRRDEPSLERFARTQSALIERAAAVVRQGGRLVYATCSSEPEENEAVVDAFLASNPEFELLDLRSQGSAPLQPLLDTRGMLRTLPFAHGLEAFFAAAMVRSTECR